MPRENCDHSDQVKRSSVYMLPIFASVSACNNSVCALPITRVVRCRFPQPQYPQKRAILRAHVVLVSLQAFRGWRDFAVVQVCFECSRILFCSRFFLTNAQRLHTACIRQPRLVYLNTTAVVLAYYEDLGALVLARNRWVVHSLIPISLQLHNYKRFSSLSSLNYFELVDVRYDNITSTHR